MKREKDWKRETANKGCGIVSVTEGSWTRCHRRLSQKPVKCAQTFPSEEWEAPEGSAKLKAWRTKTSYA